MRDLHHLIDTGSVKHQQKINKLTEPLQRHFGINYFCYQRVSNAGEWTLLSNNADWLHHSADKRFYLCDPSLVNPELCQSGFSFPETHQHADFQNALISDAVSLYDLCHTLAIIERTSAGCEYYFFTAPTGHAQVYNHYLNNMHLLRYTFSEYFKTQLARELATLDDHAVDIKLAKQALYGDKDNVLAVADTQSAAANFLADIKQMPVTVMLTPREQECLQLYRQGNTAKDTGRLLGISPRTVEYHLENIKQKYGCRNKRDLLKC